jgi:translation elongation factor EF-1beta
VSASSAIIQDIADTRKSQPAILTFYYCDFKEERKGVLRGLLSSLLVQLCHQSDSYCDLLSKFFKDHKNGSQHASDAALVLCLKKILGHPRQHPVYMVVDALDECPNPPVRPAPRKGVLQFLEELVKSISNLHICVTSRLEVDINHGLDNLPSYIIPLHDEEQHIDDINDFIRSFVDTEMQGWTGEDKKDVIDVFISNANGM